MSNFLPVALDSIAGTGTRLSADYVLIKPATALLDCSDFGKTRSLAGVQPSQVQSWTAIMRARPGIVPERIECVSAQVVRVHLLATTTIVPGTAIPAFAVVPGFRSILGPDSLVDRQYQRTVVRRTGSATTKDIELAEAAARDVALRENPAREVAEHVGEQVARAGGLTGIAALAGVALATFVFVRGLA